MFNLIAVHLASFWITYFMVTDNLPWLCINSKEGSSQIISLTAGVSLEYLLSSEITGTIITTSYALDLGFWHSFYSLVIYTCLMVTPSFIFSVKYPKNIILMTKKENSWQNTCLDEASLFCKLYWGQKKMKTFNNIEKLLTNMTKNSHRFFNQIIFSHFNRNKLTVSVSWRTEGSTLFTIIA